MSIRSSRFFRAFSAAVVVGLVLGGCYAGPRDYRYYVLDYVPEVSKARASQAPWPVTLLVRNFEMGEAYQRQELVYRTSAHEIRYRWKDRWALRPEHVVSDMVRKHLVEIRLFQAIQNQYEEDSPDWELRGRVVSLEEYQSTAGRFAHLEVRMDLLRASDNRVVWGKDFDLRREVKGEDPVLVVRALSSLLEASVDRTVQAVDSVLAAQLPSSQAEQGVDR
ncbi:MAG: membrane integrity-associated transporter subunit PqiC [Fibrobacteria bacterium]|nr:membrane integrity-associated transporter subunit PqiC [Fibrobacteria bacterium]